MELVALVTDIRRERGRQYGDLSISLGNCYGALILYIVDQVISGLLGQRQRDITIIG